MTVRSHPRAWLSALLALFLVLPAGGTAVLGLARVAAPAETSPPNNNEEREERQEQEERHATEREACGRRGLPPPCQGPGRPVPRNVVALLVNAVRGSIAPRPHPKLFSVRRLI